jgi:hypothetical protein
MGLCVLEWMASWTRTRRQESQARGTPKGGVLAQHTPQGIHPPPLIAPDIIPSISCR